MGCHKTNPLKSVYFLHLPEQPGKAHGLLKIFAEGIHILAEQHDFHHAVCHQVFDFLNDILRAAASLPPSYIGTIQ